MKNCIRSKKGSYIVEATLTLPVFILCVVALALIINIIAICENIGFVTARELHEIDMNAYYRLPVGALCKADVERAVLEENPKLTQFRVGDFDYLYSSGTIEDLIGLESQADFTVDNPIGIYGQIQFRLKVLTRGFTGAIQRDGPLDPSVFSQNQLSSPVVVFPKYGIRYHDPGCRYVEFDYQGEEYKIEMEAEDAKGKGYTPCLVCRGGEQN